MSPKPADGSHLTLRNRCTRWLRGKPCGHAVQRQTLRSRARCPHWFTKCTKIEQTVQEYLTDLKPATQGVNIDIWNNRADIIKKRLVTLNDSAFVGIDNIIVLLGLFLRPGVAFWYASGCQSRLWAHLL